MLFEKPPLARPAGVFLLHGLYSVLRKIGFNWTGERLMQRKPCLACPIECPFLIERNTL